MLELEGRRDQYPENMIGKGYYRDTGCEVAPSCLNCPLTICKFEDVFYAPNILKRRNADIVRRRKRGQKVKFIAARLNISKRTVCRAIQRAREL